MKLLAIDTATAACSVALVEDELLLAETTVLRRNGHAEILASAVDSILRAAGIAAAEIDALAVTVGPGSFTGVRIGVSTAKALAWGWGISVVPVNTADAAVAVMRPDEAAACVLITARKEEFYLKTYRPENGRWRAAADIQLVSLPHLAEALPEGPKLLLGDGALQYRDTIALISDECCWPHVYEIYTGARGVAAEGITRCLAGDAVSPALLVPAYYNPYKGIE